MPKHTLGAIVLLLPFAPAAHADTLSTITFGRLLQTEQYGFGQSFTTAPGAGFDDVTFNFYTTTHIIAPPVPYYYSVDPNYPEKSFAIGTGYLFSQPYLGLNSNISSSAPGFLGSSVASGNLYTFDPALTLSGNTLYYFYENSYTPTNTLIFSGGQVAGDEFTDPFPDFHYQLDAFSSNYLVTGAPVTVTPEPSSVLLLSTALLTLGGTLRRRRS